jgi:hypothetical protein
MATALGVATAALGSRLRRAGIIAFNCHVARDSFTTGITRLVFF